MTARTRSCWICAWGVFSSIVAQGSVYGIHVEGYSTLDVEVAKSRYERFYAGSLDKSNFIANHYDLSGVGRRPNPNAATCPGCADYIGFVTMISETYFITSAHTVDFVVDQGTGLPVDPHNGNIPFEFTFHEDNTQASATGLFTVAEFVGDFSFHHQDLRIGRFTTAPGPSVKRYPLLKRQEDMNYFGLPNVDSIGLVVGRSAVVRDESNNVIYGDAEIEGMSMRVARENFANVARRFPTGSTYSILFASGAQGAVNLGDDQAYIPDTGGDSGGPTFFKTSAKLALGGINAALDDKGSLLSHSISAYVEEIDALVPEPLDIITDMVGDINGDFKTDIDDLNILLLPANFNQPNKHFRNGDIDGDGSVTSDDLDLVLLNFDKNLFAKADFDGNQAIDGNDLKTIADHWGLSASHAEGDATGDGVVDMDDLAELASVWPTWIKDVKIAPANSWPLYDGGTYALGSHVSGGSGVHGRYIFGDVNLDGFVDELDEEALLHVSTVNPNGVPGRPGDLNSAQVPDGVVDAADYLILKYINDNNLGGYHDADLNQDDKIDLADIAILDSRWTGDDVYGTTSLGPTYGDFNYDRKINNLDFHAYTSYFGYGLSYGETTPTPVPEPAAPLMVVAIALGALASQRRRPGRASRPRCASAEYASARVARLVRGSSSEPM